MSDDCDSVMEIYPQFKLHDVLCIQKQFFFITEFFRHKRLESIFCIMTNSFAFKYTFVFLSFVSFLSQTEVFYIRIWSTMCKSSHFCTKGSDMNKTEKKREIKRFSHLEKISWKHSTAINIFHFALVFRHCFVHLHSVKANNMEPIKMCLLISSVPL